MEEKKAEMPEAVPVPVVRRPARRSPTTGHRKRKPLDLKRSLSSPREPIVPTSSDDDQTSKILHPRTASLSPDRGEPKKVLRKRYKSKDKEPKKEDKLEIKTKKNEEAKQDTEDFSVIDKVEIEEKVEIEKKEELKEEEKNKRQNEVSGWLSFNWAPWKKKTSDPSKPISETETEDETYEIIEASETLSMDSKSEKDSDFMTDENDLTSEFAKIVAQVEVKPPVEKLPLKQIILNCVRNSRSEFKKMASEMPQEMMIIRKMKNKCACKLFIILILCGIGSIAFKFTEGAFESFYKCGVKRVKRDFIDELWRSSHFMKEDEWKSKARRKLMDFENQLQDAFEAGMNSYSGQKNWSFINGIIYVLTIFSTIGYGHIVPVTTAGRALTIAYAIIGVPLFLTLLADFGKMFTRMIKLMWVYARRLYYTGSTQKPHKRQDEEVPGSPDVASSTGYTIDDEFNLPVTIALIVFLAYLFLGAIIFFLWEDWSFFESFYFVFISMATIGFGDFVPENQVYMMFSIVYLVFGLALTSMCINVIQEKLAYTFSQASSKLGATIGLDLGENDFEVVPAEPPAPVHNPKPISQPPSTPKLQNKTIKKGILQKGKKP